MTESEVIRGKSGYSQLAAHLLSRPVLHFVVSYCFWFTTVAVSDDLFAIWHTKSPSGRYIVALVIAAIIYYFDRRHMRTVNVGSAAGAKRE
jgi:hypothetical protein